MNAPGIRFLLSSTLPACARGRVGTGARRLLAFPSLFAVAFVLSPGVTPLAVGSRGLLLAHINPAESQAGEPQHFDRSRPAMHAIAEDLLRRDRLGSLTRLSVEIGSTATLPAFLYFAVEFHRLPPPRPIVLAVIVTCLLAHASLRPKTRPHMVALDPSYATADNPRARLAAAPADASLALPARRNAARYGRSGAGQSTLAGRVLDEAASAPEDRNKRIVQDAIERHHGEPTIVLIAHRLSTVRVADRIVVLEAGHIAGTGTCAELNALEHGTFPRLVLASAT